MSWLAITLAVVGVPVTLFLLSSVAGFVLPPRITGRHTLRKMLKQRGVPAAILTDNCVTELVDRAITMASLQKKMRNEYFNSALYDQLNFVSVVVYSFIVSNPGDKFHESLIRHGGVVNILMKFGVQSGQRL